MATITRLIHDEAIELFEPVDVLGQRCISEDVVRTRSRHARAVVENQVDVAILLDSDVSCEPGLLRRMVAAVMTGGRDIVCAPYPRRQSIDFEAVARPDEWNRPPESRAYRYDMKLLPEMKTLEDLMKGIQPDGCVEVEAIPIGCSVIRRTVFEKMIEHYRTAKTSADLEAARDFGKVLGGKYAPTNHESNKQAAKVIRDLVHELELWRRGDLEGLEWDDDFDGQKGPCVALFMLKLANRKLQGEDVSFLIRARALGYKVHAFFGPGSPATHHGTHAFRGNIAAFGIFREEQDPAKAAATRPTDPAPAAVEEPSTAADVVVAAALEATAAKPAEATP